MLTCVSISRFAEQVINLSSVVDVKMLMSAEWKSLFLSIIEPAMETNGQAVASKCGNTSWRVNSYVTQHSSASNILLTFEIVLTSTPSLCVCSHWEGKAFYYFLLDIVCFCFGLRKPSETSWHFAQLHLWSANHCGAAVPRQQPLWSCALLCRFVPFASVSH